MPSYKNIHYGFRLWLRALRYGMADARGGTVTLASLLVLALAAAGASHGVIRDVNISFAVFYSSCGFVFAIYSKRCFELQERGYFSWSDLITLPLAVWSRAGQVLLFFFVPHAIFIMIPHYAPAKPWLFGAVTVLLSLVGWTALPSAMNDAIPGAGPIRTSASSLRRAWEPIAVLVTLFLVVPADLIGYLANGIVEPLASRLGDTMPAMSFTPYFVLYLLTTLFVLLMIHASVATYRAITGRLVI